MNVQFALIPHKHVRFNQSILGIAGYIRSYLNTPRTVDEIIALMSNDSCSWGFKPTFEHIIFALDTLFALKQIVLVSDNRVQRRDNPHETH